jgi:tRNA(His) 5'-end guanylyltransferase
MKSKNGLFFHDNLFEITDMVEKNNSGMVMRGYAKKDGSKMSEIYIPYRKMRDYDFFTINGTKITGDIIFQQKKMTTPLKKIPKMVKITENNNLLENDPSDQVAIPLGERMKEYEYDARIFLKRNTHYIIRIDGRSFSKYTKGLDKPFDEELMSDMIETTKYLCQNISLCKFGYTQSDEISLVLTDYDNEVCEPFFGGNVQKIISVVASMATAKFNQLRSTRKPKKTRKKNEQNINTIEQQPIAHFDTRIFVIDDQIEVVNYFMWRQRDAIRNSIAALAQSKFSHKKLENKNGDEMKEMLLQEQNVDWNKISISKQRGTGIVKQYQLWYRETENLKEPGVFKKVVEKGYVNSAMVQQGFYERKVWVEDNNTPIFGDNREYILSLLPSFFIESKTIANAKKTP